MVCGSFVCLWAVFVGVGLSWVCLQVIGARGEYTMPIEISFTGPARLIQVARAFMAGISRLRDVRVVFTPFEQVPFAGAAAVGTRVLSETQVIAHLFFN